MAAQGISMSVPHEFLLLFGNGIKSLVIFRSGISESPFFASDDGFLFFIALLLAKEKKF
jgi:hypothetical protein